jgi:ABC-2 type transport system ATP-binding protein
MIEIRQLTKRYGPILALDKVDLDVQAGQIVGFLGPNGAGKTTTLRILTGFMPATSGRASVNGADVLTESDKVRRSIGYLPENTPLYPEMRVEEQLHFFGKLQGLSRPARRQRIDELADRCGLADIRHRPIGQLSKGNRQRVGLAQALLHDPPVLILDEPTVGLDPSQISAVRQLIIELGREKTILLSTHILSEVERTCGQVVIIAAGRIAAQGTPEQLRAQVREAARVLVEVKADPVAVSKAFEAVDGVSQVQTESRDGWCTATVAVDESAADPREALGRVVMENGWALRELRHEMASLEDFFVKITEQQEIDRSRQAG